MEVICAFKLPPFLSSTGRPMENQEMIEVDVSRPTHHRRIGRLESMHPGNHKTRGRPEHLDIG